jgi:hypothetical protein
MDNTKQKYIKMSRYNEIIIFNAIFDHSDFRNFNPISAGFCYVSGDKVTCFGESTSLGMESKKDDSYFATKQLFGYDCAEKIK